MSVPQRRRRRRATRARPLRVAQVCPAVDGALWMVQIGVGLRALGYDVVAIIGGPDGGTAAALRKVGIPFVAFPHALTSASPVGARLGALPIPGVRVIPRLFDAAALLGTAVRLARVLRRLEVDVVHTHVFASIIVGRLAAFLARVPLRVAMVPGPYHLEVPLFRQVDLATAWMDHRIIAGCEHTDGLYRELGVPPTRRRFVGYGIDPDGYDPATADGGRIRRELGLAADTPLIGQVAVFYPRLRGRMVAPAVDGRGIKGHEDFVHAARAVLDRRPDARFLLVGHGWGEAGTAHMEDIRGLCRSLGIEKEVVFTGLRTDVPDILAALDVSVQCSLTENYGGTIESLLMARPTIATRVGGMPETVRHEETGLLVAPRDPDALAAAMLRLVDDRVLARRLGEAGRSLMLARHTIQHTIAGVDGVYRELAAERGVPVLAAPASSRPPLLMPGDVLARA